MSVQETVSKNRFTFTLQFDTDELSRSKQKWGKSELNSEAFKVTVALSKIDKCGHII